MINNTNFQTFHQMGNAINDVVKQATGRDNVQNIDMDYVTVAQNKRRVEKVVTGEVASFYADADCILDYLIVNINPSQSGSGVPSPENVRPITGWTGAKVTRTGKNLFEPTEDTYKVQSGVTFNGYDVESLVSFLNTLKIGSYIISFKFNILETISGATSWGILIQNTQSGYIDGRINGQHDSGETLTFTKTFTITESNIGKYAHAYLYSGGGNKAKVYWYDFQFELGSTATAYEPYQGETYDITFPSEAGTVYGGTLTIHQDGTGTLVVKKADLDLGTVPWMRHQSKSVFRTYNQISGMSPSTGGGIVEDFICDSYKTETWSHVLDAPGYDCCICEGWGGSSYIAINDSRYNDYTAEQFQAAMSGVHIVYNLATPVTYQLTAQEIRTLLGVNNIWADTGNVTVMYSCFEEVI